jgi:arylsulfatase A-like enzyme
VIALDATVGFSQSGLVPFCYGVAAVILTVMWGARLSSGVHGFRLGLALNVAVVFAGWIGLVVPAYADRGRADLHRTASSLAHLDMHLTRRDPAPSLFEKLSVTRDFDCEVPAPARSTVEAPLGQRNVIIVSIDSVRTDDAGAHIDGKPLMPELARFMEESWTAPRAYSAYPATLISLSTTFSGLLPSTLMMHSPAPPSIVGGALRDTHQRVAVLPKGSYFQREPVEHYIVQGAQRIPSDGAEDATSKAVAKLQELRAQGKQHVLWVHYIEPHEPYVHHAGFGNDGTKRERYRSELAYVDHALGTLFSTLRSGGWYDDSAIFVLSDHGEAFGEHGQEFHHFQLYPWLIQVPFAVHLPGQKPRTLSGPVQLTDLAATALEFVGKRPAFPLDGRSLLSDPPRADRVIVSEEFPAMLGTLKRYASARSAAPEEAQRRAQELEHPRGYPSKVSVIQHGHQLIVHRGTGVMELYDLARDPGAENNLAYADRRRTGALEAALDGWFTDIARRTRCPNVQARAVIP